MCRGQSAVGDRNRLEQRDAVFEEINGARGFPLIQLRLAPLHGQREDRDRAEQAVLAGQGDVFGTELRPWLQPEERDQEDLVAPKAVLAGGPLYVAGMGGNELGQGLIGIGGEQPDNAFIQR